MTSYGPTVAIIWSRFGPYHMARLRGVVHVGVHCGAQIHGLEVAEMDAEYSWEVCKGEDPFKRHTLFPRQNYATLSRRKIAEKTVSALNEIQPNAVALNGWSVPEALAALAWCSKQRSVSTVVMSATKEDDAPRLWWKELIKKRRIRACSAALVGGRLQKDYLVKLGFAEDRVFLGYDVVDNEYFNQEAAKARMCADSARRALSLPGRFFFACTRFLPRKNLDGLLRAYALYRARSSTQPWSLVVAGAGTEEGNLRGLEGNLGLNGVVWPGFLQYPMLPVYYGLADAFVHSAKSEAWGLVVNEAAACGLPLLVSKTVGARYDLVQEGHNGFTFDPFSAEEMCEVLLSVSQMPQEKLDSMGEMSRQIMTRWTPRTFGEGLFSAIDAASR